jgi:hypothetical protein
MTALILLGAVLAGATRWRIRLATVSQTVNRTTRYPHCMRRLWFRSRHHHDPGAVTAGGQGGVSVGLPEICQS